MTSRPPLHAQHFLDPNGWRPTHAGPPCPFPTPLEEDPTRHAIEPTRAGLVTCRRREAPRDLFFPSQRTLRRGSMYSFLPTLTTATHLNVAFIWAAALARPALAPGLAFGVLTHDTAAALINAAILSHALRTYDDAVGGTARANDFDGGPLLSRCVEGCRDGIRHHLTRSLATSTVDAARISHRHSIFFFSQLVDLGLFFVCTTASDG